MPRMPFIGVPDFVAHIGEGRALFASFASRASFAASMASSSAALRRVISCNVPITRLPAAACLRVTPARRAASSASPASGAGREVHIQNRHMLVLRGDHRLLQGGAIVPWTRLSIKRSG